MHATQIKADADFIAKWPFFGPWFLRLVEMAPEQGVSVNSLALWRAHYLDALEPSEALSRARGLML